MELNYNLVKIASVQVHNERKLLDFETFNTTTPLMKKPMKIPMFSHPAVQAEIAILARG